MSKAFDKIDHSIISSILSALGFGDDLRRFFESYLRGRKMSVAYNGFNSKIYVQNSGVPQGSILGPFLFTLYINNIAHSSASGILLYADDIKVFSSITCEEDCFALNHKLQEIVKACNKLKLKINPDKSCVVSYTRKTHPILYEYQCGMDVIKRNRSHKDLGVKFSSDLNFNNHIQTIILDANKNLGFIRRNCLHFTDITALKALYYAFVRSKLEYSSTVWSPYYNHLKLDLERIQRKFLKILYKTENGQFPQRGINHDFLLSEYNMTSLEDRRKIADIKFIFKLIRGVIDCPELLQKITSCKFVKITGLSKKYF